MLNKRPEMPVGMISICIVSLFPESLSQSNFLSSILRVPLLVLCSLL